MSAQERKQIRWRVPVGMPMTADVTVARAHHSCPNTTTTLAAIRAASTGPRIVADRTGASPCAAATTGETATAATAGTIVGIGEHSAKQPTDDSLTIMRIEKKAHSLTRNASAARTAAALR